MTESVKLLMSAQEIKTSYMQAANRKAQIGVLADLNACSKQDIKDVLKAIGAPVDDEKYHKWTTLEDARLKELLEAGCSQKEIGEQMGLRATQIHSRLSLLGLTEKKRRADGEPKPERPVSREENKLKEGAEEMEDEPHGWVEEEPPGQEEKLQAALEPAAAEQAKKILEEAEAMNKESEIPELRDIPIRPLSPVEAQLVLTHDKMQEMLCRAVGTELQAGREALLVDMLAALCFEVLQYFSKGETHGRVDAGDQ